MVRFTSRHGNKTSTAHGQRDAWVLRLGDDGRILWDRSLGGSDADVLQRALAVPGGYLFAGFSSSPPEGTKTSAKHVTEPFGSDGWLARTDLDGRPIWDQTYGASLTHEAMALARLPDGSLFAAGRGCGGTNGTRRVPGFGGSDGYAVRLAEDEGRLAVPSQISGEIEQLGLRLSFTGLTNLWYRLERSPDLIRWGTLTTIRGDGTPASVTDLEAASIPRCFYRARLISPP